MVEPSSSWLADLELIRDAAAQAAEIAHGYFGHAPEVWWKNEGRSPVSAADFAANDQLQKVLLKGRPNYGWLSEETDDDPARLSCETLFVVDPIDGTRGFINGDKRWCVSVAVVHRGRPVAGVLSAPSLGEEFYAVADGPAWRNDEMISVRGLTDARELMMAADEPALVRLAPLVDNPLRRFGHVPSLAYRIAMVADGRIDATIVKRNSNDWDLAAADLILERAGGALTDMEGQAVAYNRESPKHGVLLAGAAATHGKLLAPVAELAAG